MQRSPVVKTSTPISSDKRNLSQVSIASDDIESGGNQQKLIKWDTDLQISPLAETSSSEGGKSIPGKNIMNNIKLLFKSLYAKLDKQMVEVVGRIDLVNNRLEEEFSRRQLFEDEITEKVEELESANKVLRTSNEELKKSSDELSRRLSVIESRENVEQPVSTPTFSEWQPSGTHQTKVLLIGDSNSAGKLKSGEGKGTLGKALPGLDRFCATVEDLPDTNCDLFIDITDVIIAVGTNNMKNDSCNPTVLARNLNTYIGTMLNKHPSIHVFLPGVLPTCSNISAFNDKIKQYNHYLGDLCRTNPRLTYIDTNTFRSSSGALKPALGRGDSDPLHLNDGGLKFYFSRFKYALRSHYNLPVNKRFTPKTSSNHGNPGVTAGGEPPRGEWGPRRGSVSRGDSNSRGRGGASGNNAGRRGNNTGRGGGATTGSGAAVR